MSEEKTEIMVTRLVPVATRESAKPLMKAISARFAKLVRSPRGITNSQTVRIGHKKEKKKVKYW